MIKIALYGCNGHQLSQKDIINNNAKLIAVCDCKNMEFDENVKICNRLDELLEIEEIQLVSICSGFRSEQAKDIKKALLCGKNVLCEKPCAMTENDINELIEISEQKNLILAEMNNIIFEQPYAKARELIQQGDIGIPVQIFVQKSYPYADWRPQDENIDGGLIMQNAIYGLRFVELVVGEEIERVEAIETDLGNPSGIGLKMACSLQCVLKNKGIATVTANYLNSPVDGKWAFEELRVFGTDGIICTNISSRSVELRKDNQIVIHKGEDENCQLSRIIEAVSQNAEYIYPARKMLQTTKLAVVAKKGINYIL